MFATRSAAKPRDRAVPKRYKPYVAHAPRSNRSSVRDTPVVNRWRRVACQLLEQNLLAQAKTYGLEGAEVEKDFEGTMYPGQVTEIGVDQQGNAFWTVVYDDGDKEDLLLLDLFPILKEKTKFKNKLSSTHRLTVTMPTRRYYDPSPLPAGGPVHTRVADGTVQKRKTFCKMLTVKVTEKRYPDPSPPIERAVAINRDKAITKRKRKPKFTKSPKRKPTPLSVLRANGPVPVSTLIADGRYIMPPAEANWTPAWAARTDDSDLISRAPSPFSEEGMNATSFTFVPSCRWTPEQVFMPALANTVGNGGGAVAAVASAPAVQASQAVPWGWVNQFFA